MTRTSQRRRNQEIASSPDPHAGTSTTQSSPPTGKSKGRKRAKSATNNHQNSTSAATFLSSRKRSSSSVYPAKYKARLCSENEGRRSSELEIKDEDGDDDEEDELTDPEGELEGEVQSSNSQSRYSFDASVGQMQSLDSYPTAASSSASRIKVRRGGGNRKGTAPEARLIHNATERARREDITNRINDLGKLLPSLAGVKRPGKPRIVTEAITFVDDARCRELYYKKQIFHLSLEKEKLQKSINAAIEGEVLDIALDEPPSPYDFKKYREAVGRHSAGRENGEGRNRNSSNASASSAWTENRDFGGMALNHALHSQVSFHSSQDSNMTPGYSPSGSSADLPPSQQPNPVSSSSGSAFLPSNSFFQYPHGFDEHSRRASIAAPGYQPHPSQFAPFYSPTFPQHQERQSHQHHSTAQFYSGFPYSSLGASASLQNLNSPALQRQFSHDVINSSNSTASASHQAQPSPYLQEPVLFSNSNSFVGGQNFHAFASQSHLVPHERSTSETGLQQSQYASSSPNQQFQRLHQAQTQPSVSPLSRSKEVEAEDEDSASVDSS